MPPLTQETRARLELFQATLLKWNASINLISRRDESQVWARHIEDSLQVGALWPTLPARAIDLGSGGGFPGLVLAIAHGVRFDLIEEDARKCAFLREAARITGASVTVHGVGIERAVVDPAPVITARALARVGRLLDYATPLLAAGGECWFLKGRGVEAELADAEPSWRMRVEKYRSRTDPDGVILRLSDITRRGG